MSSPIITENAAELISLLEAEADPRRRAVLTDLLIAEENEIARTHERSALAEALIARGREHLRRQRNLLAKLPADDPRRPQAERLLENMTRLQNLFEAHGRLFAGRPARVSWRREAPPHFGDL